MLRHMVRPNAYGRLRLVSIRSESAVELARDQRRPCVRGFFRGGEPSWPRRGSGPPALTVVLAVSERVGSAVVAGEVGAPGERGPTAERAVDGSWSAPFDAATGEPIADVSGSADAERIAPTVTRNSTAIAMTTPMKRSGASWRNAAIR